MPVKIVIFGVLLMCVTIGQNTAFHVSTTNATTRWRENREKTENGSARVGAIQCIGIGTCFCQTPDQKTIDLTNLGAYIKQYSPGGVITAKDPSFSTMTYYYNPCSTFTAHGCDDVYVCRGENGAGDDIGSPSSFSPTWDYEQSTLAIGYIAVTYAASRVDCICDETAFGIPILTALGETPIGSAQFSFSIRHECCCPGGCQNVAGSGGLSAGSILLILLFVGIIFYAIVGTAINYRIFGARTSQELIPNRSFWISIPGLVKDGTTFIVGGVRKRTTYTEI